MEGWREGKEGGMDGGMEGGREGSRDRGRDQLPTNHTYVRHYALPVELVKLCNLLMEI